jgi:hypothetical protein
LGFVEYQFVYITYSIVQLLGQQRSRQRTGYNSENNAAQPIMEIPEWSAFLNQAAQEGYSIKESGVLQMPENVVFWALLEKS